jgi:thiamine-phosphate pyrophosphorylase
MISKLASLSADLNSSYRLRHPAQKNALFLPCVIMITDHEAMPHPEKIIPHLPQNSYLIFRDYDMEDRAVKARALQQICRKHKVLFGIAADEKLARELKADGLHLPEYRLSEIPSLKKEFFITAACHSETSLKEAYQLFADAALFAPVFATDSHPKTKNNPNLTLGAVIFNDIASRIKLPIYALGGITENNILELENAAGIAAIRGFLKK